MDGHVGPVGNRGAAAGTATDSVVVFTLDGERFGVPADDVEEVVKHVRVRRLPGLPEHAAGVVVHRGRWIPAVEPAPLLGVSGAGEEGRDAALVLRRGAVRYALLADTVEEARAVDGAALTEARLRDAPDDARADGGPVLLGDAGIVALFDPDTLFRSPAPPEGEEDEMTQVDATTMTRSLVVFRLGADEFGLDVFQVQEVLTYERPRAVPRAPAFVEGVLDLRGTVLPVVDLRARLELEPAAPDDDTRILVVALEEERIGLIVDAVTEVLHLPEDAVRPPPKLFRGLEEKYLDGLARTDGRLLILLRMDRVLTAEERLALLGAEFAGGETPDGVTEAGSGGNGEPSEA